MRIDFLTWLLLILLVVVLAAPFALRPPSVAPAADAVPLVIISPHNEAIRYEFGRAFSRWHAARYGQPVAIDWRTTGGTSEIARYLSAQFSATFRQAWTAQGGTWSAAIAAGFNDPRVDREDVAVPAEVRQARQAFLASDVGVGIDLFFGGGEYDHARQAAMGHTVDSGYKDTPDGRATLGTQIPLSLSGERWYDPGGRWIGAALSSFGICYNSDVLATLPGAVPPNNWRDLGQPALFGRVALADPTKSGSITKAFEMVIQQAMAGAVRDLATDSEAYRAALARGWADGLNVIRRFSANARYFTDSAYKVPSDVSSGDAAAGLCIDFYGLVQAGWVARPDGTSRLRYVSPAGGTTVSADPIAMLRGAPNRETALRFITFVLSREGQNLWGLKPGTPGGPERYALHRQPIRRDFYEPSIPVNASDPDQNPYALADRFQYHAEWTAPHFLGLRLLIRTMCLDAGEELRAAWRSILAHGGPEACPEAMRVFEALPADAQYEAMPTTARAFATRIGEVRQARLWVLTFTDQYRRARQIVEDKDRPL